MAFKFKDYQWADLQLQKKHKQYSWITIGLVVGILVLMNFMSNPTIPVIVLVLGIAYVEWQAFQIKKRDKIIKIQMQSKATQEKLTQNAKGDR